MQSTLVFLLQRQAGSAVPCLSSISGCLASPSVSPQLSVLICHSVNAWEVSRSFSFGFLLLNFPSGCPCLPAFYCKQQAQGGPCLQHLSWESRRQEISVPPRRARRSAPLCHVSTQALAEVSLTLRFYHSVPDSVCVLSENGMFSAAVPFVTSPLALCVFLSTVMPGSTGS